MRNQRRGFTIVELLIVIVVIGILAAITIVAYNGIQMRGNNSKTVSAVNAYVKALVLYKTDNNTYPQVNSCLGIGYSDGVCRSDSGLTENGSNLNSVLLAPYLQGTPPTPSLKPVNYNNILTITGAFYNYNDSSYNPSGAGMGVMILGTSQCPSISKLAYFSSSATVDGNVLCRYRLND